MKKNSRALALCLLLGLTACSSLPEWMGGDAPEKPKMPGERYAVLLSQTIQPDLELDKVNVVIPDAKANAQWPQHMGTPRAVIGNLQLPSDFQERASHEVGGGQEWEQPLVVSPVTNDDTVFAMDARGVISAHDVANVDVIRWTSKSLIGEDEDEALGGGLAYAGGTLFAVSGRGRIVAVDASDGRELWRQELLLPFRSPPKVDGNKLFAVSIDNQLFALDVTNGTVLWSDRGIDETASYLSAVSPGAAQGLVIAPFSSGELKALRVLDGAEVWSDTLIRPQRTLATDIFSGIGADPVILGDAVLAVSSGGMMGAFLIENGRRLWSQPFSSVNTPWVAGYFIYVMTLDNQLLCLTMRDGKVKWAVQLPSYEDEKRRLYPYTWTGPIMADGKLLITGAHGQMLVVSPTDGATLETKDIPEGAYAPPVVAGGRMFIVTRDAQLHAFY